MVNPKKSIVEMKGYKNANHGKALSNSHARLMKLDSNESTVTPSPRVVAALSSYIQSGPLNWYPDVESAELIQKLSVYTGCPINSIQTFNGSDNALETICKTFIEKNDEVILCMPSYDHFRLYAESCDAKLVPVHGDNPFAPKLSALLSALTDNTKIIYVVNPNNPTGMMYSEKEIRILLTEAPDALVIVDEAYYEFSGITMAHLVAEFANLIVCRSFSKGFGLAGLRCGYIITSPENLQWINKVRVGKNVNALAQIAATTALDDVEYMEHYVAEVKSARSWIAQKIRGLELQVIETPANYILVKVAEPNKVEQFLEAQLVLIRDRSQVHQLEGFLRITIGHQLMMERFWKVFEKIPKEFLNANQESQSVRQQS